MHEHDKWLQFAYDDLRTARKLNATALKAQGSERVNEGPLSNVLLIQD